MRDESDAVVQNRALEVSNRGSGLKSEFVHQTLTAGPVDVERFRLTAAQIERQHEQADKPLTKRMLAHETLELHDDVRVVAVGEAQIDAVFQCDQAELLQPRDLGLRERLERHVRQG